MDNNPVPKVIDFGVAKATAANVHAEAVKLFREAGADIASKDADNRSAADHARWHGFESLAKTLDFETPMKPPTPPTTNDKF